MKLPRSTALVVLVLATPPASAQTPYTIAYTAGGTWGMVYAQGFSTSLGASPAPSLANGNLVNLTQFQFYKSGTADSAANIQLAIFSTLYPNTVGLTTSDSSFVGLSANTIANTAALVSGDALSFSFNNIQLAYGSDYSAMFVNVSGNALTPVLVSALTANYADVGGGDYHPAVNYGSESQYQYATSSDINNGYFSAFAYAGDANFTATLVPVPEPMTGTLLGLGAWVVLQRFRKSR